MTRLELSRMFVPALAVCWLEVTAGRALAQAYSTSTSAPQPVGSIVAGGSLDVDLAVDSTRDLVYAPNDNGTIAVIDGASNAITNVITIPGGAAAGIAVDLAANRLYVADRDQPVLWVVDPTSTIAPSPISLPNVGHAVAFNPSTGVVYVSHAVTRLYPAQAPSPFDDRSITAADFLVMQTGGYGPRSALVTTVTEPSFRLIRHFVTGSGQAWWLV